jgi:dihydropteroate synthase-like protein
VLEDLAPRAGFQYDVAVLPISVAALLHVDWIGRKLTLPEGVERVILPGMCDGDVATLTERFGVPFERGPKSMYDLPEHFGRDRGPPPDLSRYDVEILAEINHAPRLDEAAIVERAARYRAAGADVIDLGGVPGESWGRVGEVTRRLVGEGFRVSIDSFDRTEVEAAVAGGAELVLSCNGTNVGWAADLGVEVVAIPDEPSDLDSLERTIAALDRRGARFRIDPILEPIGFGFAASLARYLEARRRWPHAPMLMGVGNLTELTEVDSAGINVLLAAICQELRIHSVLTTEVVNWCRSAVREFDLARRLVRHAVENRVLPKHVDPGLVMLRDAKVHELGPEALAELAARIKDADLRIFAERGEIHVLGRDGYWHGRDPFEVFDRLAAEGPPLDASHAFYLGYEFAKAATALALGKRYEQDNALDWGFLTVPEVSAHERRCAERGR